MIRAIIASTLVLGLFGLAATIAFRASASVRHAIWFVGLTTALGVGALAAIGPIFEVESTLVNRESGVGNRESWEPVRKLGVDLPINTAGLAADDSRLPIPDSRFPIPALRSLLLAAWLVGVAFILGRAVLGHMAAARLVSRSRHVDADLRLDVDASIDVRLSPDLDGPFTLGALRPVILLPLDAQYWTTERLRIVLVHEAAHVARLDYLAQLVATIACAVYWFNPITWLAASRLRAEAEHAADDRVLAAGVDGVTYASHLLELARPESAPLSTAMAVGMARGTTRLEKRFAAMLDSHRSRGIVPLRLQAAVGSAAMLVAVPFTSLRLIPASPKPMPVALEAPAPLAVVAPIVLSTRSPVKSQTRQSDTVIDRTLPASAGETISISLKNGGGVTIKGWNQNQVRVHGVLSGTQARETEVIIERVSGGIELRTEVPRRSGNTSNSNHFELWVPSKFNINLTSGGGEISIAGVEGQFRGNTGGGEIILDNVSGRADLTTGGGEVRVTNSSLDGSVTTGGGEAYVTGTTGNVRVTSGSGPVIRTTSGDTRVYGVGGLAATSVSSDKPLIVVDGQVISGRSVSVTKAGGDLRYSDLPEGGTFLTGGGSIDIGSVGGKASFTTGGGDVRIMNVSDDLSVATGAGSVEISVIGGGSAARNISVSSGSGRIIIELPANLDARLDLETAWTDRNGPTKIQSDFPVNVIESQEWDYRNGTPRRYVRGSGTVGSGRGLVKIHTVNGDVVIRKR